MTRRILFFPIIALLSALCAQAHGEAVSVAVRQFLGANISGYAQYLSVEEFSELRTMQDALLYCERNDEEAVFNEIAALYEEKCLAIKERADAQFSARIAAARRKLAALGTFPESERLRTELSRLESAFSSAHVIPQDSKVLRDIERHYSSGIAQRNSGREKTYTVQYGDCLVSIAETQCGTYKKWRALYEANRDMLPVPENPALIYPGMVFVIPREAD